MSNPEIEALVQAANSRYTDPERNRIIREVPGESPRFELYHFHLSLCSYKLRTTLDEKNATYMSHDVEIFPPILQNYYPEYVRLRLKGGESLGVDMVNGYTGRSSTETEGFDPCVVPTLVDHEAGQVLVNSKRMCLYLDSVLDTGTKLVPDDITDQVIRQVDAVDRSPHVAILYGANPDGDRRPEFVQQGMKDVHLAKIAGVRRNMAEAGDDPALIAAYEHKIAKEEAAREFILTEQDMRGAIQEFEDLIAQLEQDLAASDGEWMFGDRYTLADLFWAVSLWRVKWAGYGYIIESDDGEVHYPRVAAYTKRVLDRPSFQRSVIHWPLHPTSVHVMEYYDDVAAENQRLVAD